MPNLTHLIKSPRNTIGQFCRTNMAGRAAGRSTNKILSALDTTMPEGEGQGYPWMLIGTAFDYRVRLFFESEFNFEGTMALGRMSKGNGRYPRMREYCVDALERRHGSNAGAEEG